MVSVYEQIAKDQGFELLCARRDSKGPLLRCLKGHIFRSRISKKNKKECPICAKEKMRFRQKERVEKVFSEIGLNLVYCDYKKQNDSKVLGRCERCGCDYENTFYNAVRLKGCPSCRSIGMNYIDRLHRLLGGRQDVQLIEIEHGTHMCVFYCKKCGKDFDRYLGNAVLNVDCPDCNREEFKKQFVGKYVEEAEKKGLKILHVSKESGDAFVLECDKGHVFHRNRFSLMKNQECPICNLSNGGSRYEKEICEYLDELGVEYEVHTRKIIAPYEIDIYVPKFKFGIEFHGLYHHSYEGQMNNGADSTRAKNIHAVKADLAEKAEINLMQIFEDEWLYKKKIIKDVISMKVGVVRERKSARECKVVRVPWAKAKKFLNEYHIHGAGKACSLNYGLELNGRLEAVICFSRNIKSRGGKIGDGEYELYKFCTEGLVRGGFGKLLKAFEREHRPNKIFSYVDRRFFNGNSFIKNGFVEVKRTVPNYYYFMKETIERFHRYSLRKDWVDGETEVVRRQAQGYLKIYDAGHLRLEKTY